MKSCPGAESKDAGKADACKGCPNANICANTKPDSDIPFLKNKYNGFKHKISVMCGKGGVGKSFLSFVIAKFLSESSKVLLLDLDITGPTIPQLTNTQNRVIENIFEEFSPITQGSLGIVSSGYFWPLIEDNIEEVNKNAILKAVLKNCRTEEYDILVVDTPPNITDEHLAIFSYMEQVQSILITTPQTLSFIDFTRQMSFCKKAKIQILGVVENMKGIKCNKCNFVNSLSKSKNIQTFCIENKLCFLGSLDLLRKELPQIDKGTFVFAEELVDLKKKIFIRLKKDPNV